jgi:hypothetical protein
VTPARRASLSPARRAPRRAWLAAAVVIAVAGAGLAVAVTSRGGGPGPARRPPVPAARPAASGPRLPPVSLTGLRWSDYHGVRLPSSPAAGPRHTASGLAWGFSDTPLGALLAALDIAVRANAQWGPDVFVPDIRDQVTGPDAAALLASCQASYGQASQAAHITGGGPLGNAYVTEQAFRWVAYTPADATVDLVSAGPGSGGVTVRASTRVEVVWQGGDWRVVAPPAGDWGNAAARLPSLAGYTTFPGQGG